MTVRHGSRSPLSMVKPIRSVVVLGANGAMGSGSGAVFAAAGIPTVFLARTREKAEAGRERAESMVKSMELQAAAERERKAVVTKAEGEKQAMILAADGRLESAKRDAIAQVTLAESSSAAIQKVAQAVGDRDTPMLYLLGEKYILALDRLAASGNSKIVVLPADLQDTLRGILGRART